ncbi:MAG: hypothetical protein RDU01_08180 [Thermodesulfovibrionales bacterium]|nr:hypothetical protein [Thermodesulfovibrionales bacterium]
MNYLSMEKGNLARLFISTFSLVLLVACATTSLTAVWIDEAYQGGPLQNVVILGVMQPAELRKAVEDTLAGQLGRRGIKAVQSYTLFPEDMLPDQKELEAMVKEQEIDTVFVVRFLQIDDINLYLTYPPYVSNNLYGYYSYCCQNVISSGYHVRFETTIFDAKTQKVIWSAPSDTQLERTRETIVESYVDAILQNLYANKLIR